jgi:GAF domain-containing protein
MTDRDRIDTSSREATIVDTFVQLADTLIEDYDVIEFLGLLSGRCVALVDADEAGIMVTDGQGHLQVVATSSERTRLLELFELQNQQGPALEAFTAGAPVTSSDLAVEEGRWPNFARRATSVGFRSVHSVPMRLRNETIGVLSLLRGSVGSLETADVKVVGALAQVATIGLLQERAISLSKTTASQLRTALLSRVRIEQAKGVIAERNRVDVDTAFQQLRNHARRRGARLSDLAERVVRDNIDISD